MKKFALLLIGTALWLGLESKSTAQVVYTTYYQPAPTCQPVNVYYAPPTVAYQPVARVRTRYRPLLGGTVTRVRYGYAPAYYAPAPMFYAY